MGFLIVPFINCLRERRVIAQLNVAIGLLFRDLLRISFPKLIHSQNSVPGLELLLPNATFASDGLSVHDFCTLSSTLGGLYTPRLHLKSVVTRAS